MNGLALDIFDVVAQFMDDNSIVSLLSTCKQFYKNDVVWREIYNRNYWRNWRIVAKHGISCDKKGYREVLRKIETYRPSALAQLAKLNPSDAASVNVVLLGDKDCGKTSILVSYLLNKYENYKRSHNVIVTFNLGDCAYYDVPGSYTVEQALTELPKDMDNLVFALCFNERRETFKNAVGKWAKELYEIMPNAKVNLIMCETINWHDEQSYMQPARDIGCFDLIVCSSLTQKRLMQAFENLHDTALRQEKVRKKKCMMQ
jgi:GTPase SAR1 family protein